MDPAENKEETAGDEGVKAGNLDSSEGKRKQKAYWGPTPRKLTPGGSQTTRLLHPRGKNLEWRL